MSDYSYDAVIVGSGHAGSCAALSLASDFQHDRVLMIDKCPPEWAGGNGYFTAGAHRTVHNGLDDLLPVIHDAESQAELIKTIDMDPYTHQDFVSDIMRLSQGRSNPAIVDAVVSNSRDAITWLAERAKIPFTFSFNRQAYLVNGRQKFWGGMVLSVKEGGKGLIAAHHKALEEAGVKIWFNTAATKINLSQDGTVSGLEVKKGDQTIVLKTSAVILACGGYEASKDLRIKYLGPQWEHARVRGTPYNTGDAFDLCTSIGALLTPTWDEAGCHSTAWDANASRDSGDRVLTNQYTKSGYPLGLMLNVRGERFVDEGEDMRNYTYAKFGRAILEQPDGMVFQVWDSQVTDMLRVEEYGEDIVERIVGDSLEELAEKLVGKGLKDKERFLSTIEEYNAAVRRHREKNPEVTWNPAIKDGLSTLGLDLPKSNWALTIDKGPFLAVKVSSGITFTFGGLAIDPDTAGVLSQESRKPIPGLYATGEVVGDLFYHNYPGGSGLTAGAVFGRKAAKSAAQLLTRP